MEKRRPQKLAVILHADIVGSTALVRQDEPMAHERIQNVFRRFSETIKAYGGIAHELRGDALVAEFDRASAAVSAALAFQSRNAEFNATLEGDIRPQLRVGIGMGEVVIADRTVTGAGVVLAQRLEQLADPGGVCIQGAAYETVPQRLPFSYERLGEQEIKGFDEPVRAYAVTLTPGHSIPAPERPGQPTGKRLVVGAVALVLIVVVGFVWFQPWVMREEPASIERMAFPLPDKPSIAVLPFANLGHDPSQDLFSDGITNDIITDLSRFNDLMVIASNSTFTYKGKPTKVQQVAEELGVRYVLEGSIQRLRNDVRVNVQFIDAVTGEHLWAERYDRELSDIFAVQDEITQKVAAKLGANEGRVAAAHLAQAKRKAAVNLNAYELVLLGQEHRHRFNKEDNERSRELLEKAIAIDPEYARAHVDLAWTHLQDIWQGNTDTPAVSAKNAYDNATRAIELDETLAEGYWVLAEYYLTEQPDRGVPLYERALALNPNHPDILASWGLAMALVLGKAKEGIVTMHKAMRLSPFYADWYDGVLMAIYFVARRYEDAISQFGDIEHPTFVNHLMLAASYAHAGRLEEARQETATILELRPNFSMEAESELTAWLMSNETEVVHVRDGLRKAGVPETTPLPLPDKPSIAVLPFTNMSDDPAQEYFADGITEDLTTDLSKISGLFVIARNSAFTYKGKTVKPEEVARELGVRHILEGSVRRAGDQVRINAQLIDATTGGHLWAERYDGALQDIFVLQDQVTNQIVEALEVSLTGAEEVQQARHTTDNAEAHDAFLQGWMRYKLGTPEDLARSISHFEEAVRLDPNHSQARAALASVYWDAYVKDWAFDLDMPSFRAESRANEHLAEALKNPTPLAHALQSSMYLSTGFLEEAVQEADKAVAVDGNDATSHAALANALVLAQRPAEGVDAIRKAMRLDPHHPPSYLTTLGTALFGIEQYGEAAVAFERAVKRNPDDELPRIYLAASYGHLGRIDDGEAIIESANVLRNTRGLPALSLRKSIGYGPFRGAIEFKAFGAKAHQQRVHSGLSRIPALTWQYLVTGVGTGRHEVEGATEIDIVTAKAFHNRGVIFVDVSVESVWKKGHIPGAVNLPRYWDEKDTTKPRFQQTTLSEIVDRSEEFVLCRCDPQEVECHASFDAAKAVAWGYQNVYWSDSGARGRISGTTGRMRECSSALLRTTQPTLMPCRLGSPSPVVVSGHGPVVAKIDLA